MLLLDLDNQLLVCLSFVRVVLHHVFVRIFNSLFLAPHFLHLLLQRLDLLDELVIVGLLSALDVSFHFSNLMHTRANFALKFLVLFLFGCQYLLQLRDETVLFIDCLLQSYEFVLQRPNCYGNSLGVAVAFHLITVAQALLGLSCLDRPCDLA